MNEPTPKPTPESKELTDRIHRLVRSFSRQLVELVAQEIGARKIKLKAKPGPRPGFKVPKRLCPLCKDNPNCRRRFGYICKDCSAGKPIGWKTKIKDVWPEHRRKNLDSAGKDFKVVVPIPENFRRKAKAAVPVEVPDEEASFLDSLIEIISEPDPEPAKSEQKKPDADDDGGFFA